MREMQKRLEPAQPPDRAIVWFADVFVSCVDGSILLYLIFLFSYGAMLTYATDFYWVPYQVSHLAPLHNQQDGCSFWSSPVNSD